MTNRAKHRRRGTKSPCYQETKDQGRALWISDLLHSMVVSTARRAPVEFAVLRQEMFHGVERLTAHGHSTKSFVCHLEPLCQKFGTRESVCWEILELPQGDRSPKEDQWEMAADNPCQLMLNRA